MCARRATSSLTECQQNESRNVMELNMENSECEWENSSVGYLVLVYVDIVANTMKYNFLEWNKMEIKL